MKLYYDLHIHTCLSPCAQMDMTPGNICAMARLNGLNIIAVTDHQTAGNLGAVAACAAREGLLFLPGLEVCTEEEVHLLCYFETVKAAEEMGAWCHRHLPDIKNRPDYFGEQAFVNSEDEITGHEDKLLLMALDQSLDEVCLMVRSLGGVPVPAHINRGNNGLLTALGMIPKEEKFTALEVAENLPLIDLDGHYHILYSSDAHTLGAISQRTHTIDGVNSPGEFLKRLRHPTTAQGEKT